MPSDDDREDGTVTTDTVTEGGARAKAKKSPFDSLIDKVRRDIESTRRSTRSFSVL